MDKYLFFKCPIRGVSGYSTYARSLIKAFCEKYGDEYKIQIQSLPWQEYDVPLADADEEFIQDLEAVRVPKNKAIGLYWTLPVEFYRECKYNIGYTLFETDRIIDKWRTFCNTMDEIWVPTSFNKKTFFNSGVTPPIRVVPGGVSDIYLQDTEPMDIPEIDTRFNFVTAGQWIPGDDDRKNITKIIKAFCTAYKDNKDVGLIIKAHTYNNNTIDRIRCEKRIQQLKNTLQCGEYPRIYLMHGLMTDREIARMLSKANVAVQPSPEGWGLWHIQSAALGLPVIAMDWSSYTDFLDRDLTPLITGKIEPVSQDMKYLEPYSGNHFWMNVSEQQLADKMRSVQDNYTEWKTKAAIQQENIKNNWTWERSADSMYNALEEIHQQNYKNAFSPRTYKPLPLNFGQTVKDKDLYIIIDCHKVTGVFNLVESLEQVMGGSDFPLKKVIIINNCDTDKVPNKLNTYLTSLEMSNDRYSICNTTKLISFAKAENEAITLCRAMQGTDDFNILFLEPNVIFTDIEAIKRLSYGMQDLDIKFAGCKILNMDEKSIFSAGIRVATNTYNGVSLGFGEADNALYSSDYPVECVSGICMMTRYETLKEAGFFDEEYFIAYKNIDIQLRATSEEGMNLYLGSVSVLYDRESSCTTPDFDIKEFHAISKKHFLSIWQKALEAKNAIDN